MASNVPAGQLLGQFHGRRGERLPKGADGAGIDHAGQRAAHHGVDGRIRFEDAGGASPVFRMSRGPRPPEEM